MFPFVSLLALATLAAQATAVRWHIQEARSSPPPSFVYTGAADTSQTLTMRVNLKQGNLQGLVDKLAEVSTPGSSTFRQWLSNDDVSFSPFIHDRNSDDIRSTHMYTLPLRQLKPSPVGCPPTT